MLAMDGVTASESGTKETRPKLLLEVSVNDEGDIFLFPSGQKVSGRAIRDPVQLWFDADGANDHDVFSERLKIIYGRSPLNANAYSTLRNPQEFNEDCMEVSSENSDIPLEVKVPVQYYRLEPQSIMEALGLR